LGFDFGFRFWVQVSGLVLLGLSFGFRVLGHVTRTLC